MNLTSWYRHLRCSLFWSIDRSNLGHVIQPGIRLTTVCRPRRGRDTNMFIFYGHHYEYDYDWQYDYAPTGYYERALIFFFSDLI